MSTAPSEIKPSLARPRLVTAQERPQYSKLLKWAIAAGIGLLLAGGSMLWRMHVQNLVTYDTVPVERGSIQAKVTATGNLNAVKDVLVSSQVSGNIKALYADWNTKVKQGQLIALIDPQIFQAQVDQATAAFRSASAATVTAQAQLEKAKSDLSAAVAGEKSAEAIAAALLHAP